MSLCIIVVEHLSLESRESWRGSGNFGGGLLEIWRDVGGNFGGSLVEILAGDHSD